MENAVPCTDDGVTVFMLPKNVFTILIHHYRCKYNGSQQIEYNYKNYRYCLRFDRDYFCGYVHGLPNLENFTYEPHGGFTGGFNGFWGFDCTHFDDYRKGHGSGTFKTEDYVHLECQKIIDAVLSYTATFDSVTLDSATPASPTLSDF